MFGVFPQHTHTRTYGSRLSSAQMMGAASQTTRTFECRCVTASDGKRSLNEFTCTQHILFLSKLKLNDAACISNTDIYNVWMAPHCRYSYTRLFIPGPIGERRKLLFFVAHQHDREGGKNVVHCRLLLNHSLHTSLWNVSIFQIS